MNIKIILGTNQALKNARFEDLLGHFSPLQNIIFQGVDVVYQDDELLNPLIESYIYQGASCISFIEIQNEVTMLFLLRICLMISTRCNKDIQFVLLTSPSFSHFTLYDLNLFPEIYFYN